MKVLEAIRPKLADKGVAIGRNRLNALLKANNMLVERRKVFHPRTTRQDPSLQPSKNLVKHMELTRPNQAVCSDITYVSTDEGFLYLALVMDMVARDIVGWDISESLEADGAVRALGMAIRTLPKGAKVVAHSDRGCQYGARKYLGVLDEHGWVSSMTEELHCYENAMAERLNGILKGEYYLDCRFRTKAEYRSYILIDFNTAPKAILDIFKNDLEDLDAFFRKLSDFYGVRLHEGETLFVFDEVQECPRARAAIKYLVQDGRYRFLETGSLVSIQENVEGIVIPSEEDSVKMYPMDFEEFLWATGRAEMVETIKAHRRDLVPMGPVHRKAMDAFREYLIVGGMPQAVDKWASLHDLKKVELAKRRVLKIYRADIRKHAGKYALKAEGVFDEIPAQLMRHDKKFRMATLGESARMREYEDAFMWLKDARVVNVAYNSTEPTEGLKLSAEFSTLKCYMADTGLLLSHAFGSNPTALDEINRHLMFDSISLNKGMLIENAVAQMLTAQDLDLFFYSRYDKKDAEERMEIDFLIPSGKIGRKRNISAVEVKSEKDYITTSLDKFHKKFRTEIGKSFVLHPGDIKVSDDVACLPLYMTPWLLEFH